MNTAILRKLTLSGLVLAALALNGCGGSSPVVKSPPPPPPGQGIPSKIAAISGDKQNGVPGETLPLPLDAEVLDNQNKGVPNVTVTFSATNGGQVFPTSVVTGETGHARTLARLSPVPFSNTTITASISELNTTFTASTGPRLLATFGNVSALHGTPRPDGTFVGLSNSVDPAPGLGYDLFAADGSLISRLGPLQGKMSVPGFYDSLWSVVSSPDQSLYFLSQPSPLNESVYAVKLDNQLNLVQFSDLTRSKNVDDSILLNKMAVDQVGNLYVVQGYSQPEVVVFDSSGKKTGDIGEGRPINGLAVNSAGNVVVFAQDNTKGFVFREYSPNGQLVNSPSTQGFSASASFAQDPVGNYLVLDDVGPLYEFDQDYNLLATISLDVMPIGSGNITKIAGADDDGNFFVSSGFGTFLLKYDAGGHLKTVTAWPAQDLCTGCPSIAYANELINPTAMTIDPVTSDLYISDSASSTVTTPSILRYTNQQFANRLGVSHFLDDVAIGTARELYVADWHFNNVYVVDLDGNELRTLQGPLVGTPASIAIDSNNNKYILDASTSSIHVLDSSDQLVNTLNLNVTNIWLGGLRIAADGTLMVTLTFTNTTQRMVLRLATNGTVLFSKTYSMSDFSPNWATSDSAGNMFIAGYYGLRVLDMNGVQLGSFDVKGNAIGASCGLTRQGDTVYVCFLNRVYSLSAQ